VNWIYHEYAAFSSNIFAYVNATTITNTKLNGQKHE